MCRMQTTDDHAVTDKAIGTLVLCVWDFYVGFLDGPRNDVGFWDVWQEIWDFCSTLSFSSRACGADCMFFTELRCKTMRQLGRTHLRRGSAGQKIPTTNERGDNLVKRAEIVKRHPGQIPGSRVGPHGCSGGRRYRSRYNDFREPWPPARQAARGDAAQEDRAAHLRRRDPRASAAGCLS